MLLLEFSAHVKNIKYKVYCMMPFETLTKTKAQKLRINVPHRTPSQIIESCQELSKQINKKSQAGVCISSTQTNTLFCAEQL